MKSDASQADVDGVIERLKEAGLGAHVSGGEERTVIGVIGVGFSPDLPDTSELLPGVDHVTRITRPYKLASSEFRPTPTIVEVGDVKFGADQFVVIAGPCSVESREQLLETARAVKRAGASMLRGGAYKPRTSPYDFQGLGLEALLLLREAREETGLPLVTEVLSTDDVDTVAEYADVLQVGARNMQNFALLRRLASTPRPVMLKRGPSATIKEWLLAAEYLLAGGNVDVILCERGIKTFETDTRNTLDLAAVALARELSHLPVVVDPSHATGRRDIVPAAARAAIAVGADGLLVEGQPRPERELSDGPESLDLEGFAGMMESFSVPPRRIARAASWCAPPHATHEEVGERV